jgi:hypothetical protein
MEGEKDLATCPECGTQYMRGGAGGLIRVQEPSGEAWDVPGHRLAAAVEGRTERETSAAPLPDGGIIHRSDAEVRKSGEEAPVHWGGELLGFAEAMGERVSGTLVLTEQALSLRVPPGSRGGGGHETGSAPHRNPGVGTETWPLLEIRAVQTSSSSLQFSPASGGLVELRFPHDSPFRWETLLRTALRRVYRREGLGEIVEFQPRVVAE